MKFATLQRRVQRSERLLEGRQQQTLQHWNELRSAWREGWTPWRIVSAGLVAGFASGRAEPLAALDGPRMLRMIGTVSGWFAGAQAAVAGFAAEAADAAAAGDAFPEEPLVDEDFDADVAPVAPRPAEAATELSEH
ncbi:MAG: protein sip-5 [Pseudoxanthomonas sp.]